MRIPLTDGELEAMQVLWKHGEMSAAEMQELFPRAIRNAALRSVLLVLLEKGHVKRRKIVRTYYYDAAMPREGTLEKIARRLSDAFAGGSPAGLIAQLIESQKLSREDIADLRKVMEKKSRVGRRK
jgi:predicted transcriptional regulator